MGGGAVAFALGTDDMLLNDACMRLMDFYRAVAKIPRGVQWALDKLIAAGTDADTYYAVRASEPTSLADRAAWLYYLNRLCYNGMYRENKSGGFNVPYGKYKNPSWWPLDAASEVLSRAELWCSDFSGPIEIARAGDLVYADPPYDDKFSGYVAAAFDGDDQARLAAALQRAADRGAHVVATNASTARVHALYSWATVRPIAETRRVGGKNASRDDVTCVLITSS